MNYNLNSGYGNLLATQIAATVGPNFGQVLIVSEDSDNVRIKDMLRDVFVPDSDGRVRFFTTLDAAYTAAESNSNDVILLSAHSTHTLSAGITWSKNRVNVIGMDGGGRLVQQGVKVATPSDADEAFVLKVTGTRNSFRNIKFIQNSTNAAALTVVQFAGEGNLYEDCQFIFGVADNLDQTNAYEVVLGEDAGTFRRCSFGTDVLLTSAARAVMAVDAITGASSADGAKSNILEDCEFILQSSSATAVAVKLIDTAGAKFLNRWIRPQFHAVLNNTNSAAAVTNAIASASSFVEGSLHFYMPASYNFTNLCAGTTDNVVTYAPATAATGGEGGTPA